MRGTPRGTPFTSPNPGITPAYAGNTFFLDPPAKIAWDHPRICGEHAAMKGILLNVWGSPPHMRGTHQKANPNYGVSRITPAYAGNTLCYDLDLNLDEDHPRICGEHSFARR